MAGRPTFNPNRYKAYPSSRWRNRAVSDAFEPGSIFKIVTAAAGLQEKVVDARRGARLRPRHDRDRGHRRSTTTRSSTSSRSPQAVAKSSDIGMIRVAQRLGRDNFARYVRAFGFGAPTGVELPGESAGLFRPTATLERALAAVAVLRPGDRRHRAADHDGGGGGRERRLPDEADRREARRGRRGPRGARDASRSWCAACSSPTPSTRSPTILHGVVREGTGRTRGGPRLRGRGQDGHRPEGRRHRPLLDGRPRGVVRRASCRRRARRSSSSRRSTRRAARANQGGDVAAPLFARVAEAALRVLAVPPDDPARVLRAVGGRARRRYVPAAYRAAGRRAAGGRAARRRAAG